MVEPHSSNFRVITTNFLGVRIFRKFTVLGIELTIMILGFWTDQSTRRTVKIQIRLLSEELSGREQSDQGLRCLPFSTASFGHIYSIISSHC